MGSVVINSQTDAIRRTTGSTDWASPPSSGSTFAGWIKLDAVGAEIQYICGMANTSSAQASIGMFNTGVLFIESGGGGTSFDASPNWTTPAWIYIAVTRATGGDTARWWDADGDVGGSASRTSAGGTPTEIIVGVPRGDFGNLRGLGKYAYWRCWDAALTQEELETEMFSATVVKTTSFNCGFHDSSDGISPQSTRDWTFANISTDSDTPPVVIGLTPIVMTWTL
jgi:hypothetical protein